MFLFPSGMNRSNIKYFLSRLESKPGPDDDSYSHQD